ncbi:MAG: hypothetical protein CVU14_10105, partial [Bacteroidetes bacterium HGW-Bacteroidetes-9]
MIRQNYYFLVAGLPDVTMDHGKLQFGTTELREELKAGLVQNDFNYFQLLFLPNDNANLLSLLQKDQRPMLPGGVYAPDFLAEEIKEPQQVKPYIKRFIESFTGETRLYPNLTPENELTTLWYEEMLATDHEFLRDWFTFDLNLKNILLVISARKNDLPFENQVIGNN